MSVASRVLKLQLHYLNLNSNVSHSKFSRHE